MRKHLLGIAVLAVAAVVMASPAMAANPCVSGTLASFISAGSCTVGPLTYSSFSYIGSTTGAAVDPGTGGINIVVIPSGLEFDFSAAWQVNGAAGAETLDSDISFVVTSTSGAPIIDDLTLQIITGSCAGTGSVSLTENGGLSTGCVGGVLNTSPQHVTFAPVSTLSITKDLGLTAPSGSANTASISKFTNSVSTTVPEPGSIMLLGSGLLGLAGVLRRKVRL